MKASAEAPFLRPSHLGKHPDLPPELRGILEDPLPQLAQLSDGFSLEGKASLHRLLQRSALCDDRLLERRDPSSHLGGGGLQPRQALLGDGPRTLDRGPESL